MEHLLQTFPGEKSPKKIIIRLAQKRVTDARLRGWTGPPYCPKMLASLFGVRTSMVTHDIRGDGRILPDPKRPGRVLIEYVAGRMEERQRFTIFHELAHTLFPDYCNVQTYNQTRAPKDPEKEFEGLCDTAAAEMMMPEDDFSNNLSRGPIVGTTVLDLKAKYHASVDATIRRVVDLTLVPCGALFLAPASSQTSARTVSYSLKNSFFKGFVPPGAKVSWSGGLISLKRTTFYIDGRPRTYLAQALPLPIIPENPFYPTLALLLLPSGY